MARVLVPYHKQRFRTIQVFLLPENNPQGVRLHRFYAETFFNEIFLAAIFSPFRQRPIYPFLLQIAELSQKSGRTLKFSFPSKVFIICTNRPSFLYYC